MWRKEGDSWAIREILEYLRCGHRFGNIAHFDRIGKKGPGNQQSRCRHIKVMFRDISAAEETKYKSPRLRRREKFSNIWVRGDLSADDRHNKWMEREARRNASQSPQTTTESNNGRAATSTTAERITGVQHRNSESVPDRNRESGTEIHEGAGAVIPEERERREVATPIEVSEDEYGSEPSSESDSDSDVTGESESEADEGEDFQAREELEIRGSVIGSSNEGQRGGEEYRQQSGNEEEGGTHTWG